MGGRKGAWRANAAIVQRLDLAFGAAPRIDPPATALQDLFLATTKLFVPGAQPGYVDRLRRRCGVASNRSNQKARYRKAQ